MIATHEELRSKARTVNNEPTETDQSGAAETDLNIVLQRYSQSGTLMGQAGEPMYNDWTEYPEDFRGFIEHARTAAKLRRDLPKQLAGYTLEQLVALTPDALQAILEPPTPTQQPTEDKPK